MKSIQEQAVLVLQILVSLKWFQNKKGFCWCFLFLSIKTVLKRPSSTVVSNFNLSSTLSSPPLLSSFSTLGGSRHLLASSGFCKISFKMLVPPPVVQDPDEETDPEKTCALPVSGRGRNTDSLREFLLQWLSVKHSESRLGNKGFSPVRAGEIHHSG